MSVDLECNFHCSQFRLYHVKTFLKAVNRNHLMLHFLYTIFCVFKILVSETETEKVTMGGNDLENETINLLCLGQCE